MDNPNNPCSTELMENPLLQTPVPLTANSGYSIIACNTPDELSAQVSAMLKGGATYLHGQPFVFKDQICQAVKFLSCG
jgi:hypothetical protein